MPGPWRFATAIEQSGKTLQEGPDHLNKCLKTLGDEPRAETFYTETIATRIRREQGSWWTEGAMRVRRQVRE